MGADVHLVETGESKPTTDTMHNDAVRKVLDPAELSKGLESLTTADAREKLARRLALNTSLSLDAALPIVTKALADSSDNVLRAAQQISSKLAEPTFWSDRRETAQKFVTIYADVSKAALATIEKSSRWGLLSIAAWLGFFVTIAPYLLIMIRGSSAETTPEYLVTSLSGSAVVVAGLIGIIISDRGVREAAKDINNDAVERMKGIL